MSEAYISDSVLNVPIMESNDSIPQDGHVRLILISNHNSSFYLEIPLHIIDSLCLKPRKYLVFLGWCILGVPGRLPLEDGGRGMTTQGPLEDQGIYYYVADVGGMFSSKLLLSYLQILTMCYSFNEDLATAVDLEVIKQRTNVPSETTGSHDDFRDRLLKRDISCVWTGVGFGYGTGMHIIPFKQGSEVCLTFLFFAWNDT